MSAQSSDAVFQDVDSMHCKTVKRFELIDNDGELFAAYDPPDGLSEAEVAEGVSFIRRRFFEDWQIRRHDVTPELLVARGNLRLFSPRGLIGWLGIEATGELDNGCIDVEGMGSSYLTRLIRFSYECWDGAQLYAYVPPAPLTSAHACLRAGMRLDAEPDVITRNYPEKAIRLVRLYNVRPFLDHLERIGRKENLARIAKLRAS